MEISFSTIIKELRKERGITQEELATYLGISVQSVSKWERGDGMPDISLLPHIAAFYDTTVDYLLGCDAARQQKEIETFKTQAQALVNKGKRRESLELCREYQKKYPHNETVLNRLMHDLYIVDRIGNSSEIFAIADKLLGSKNSEIHFAALTMLALTHASIGNDQIAVDYAKRVPTNKDLLRLVLKGDELVEHCKWYFWKVCDELNIAESQLTTCPEANYSPEERHAIRKGIYDIFHIVFSDGDFGFWENRLASICRGLALCSIEAGQIDRAFAELNIAESQLTTCPEANYSPEERHAIRKAIYDIFHIVFSDGDFGFWENRLASICRGLALCSIEAGQIDRAFAELEEMCDHLERYAQFTCIDHTSPMVKGLHYEDAQVGRSSERSLASIYLNHLDVNPIFQKLEENEKLLTIKNRLQALG